MDWLAVQWESGGAFVALGALWRRRSGEGLLSGRWFVSPGLQVLVFGSIFFFFGMGHYFGGTPASVDGALITGALGWLWAIMILDTRGIFVPWLNHFLNNVPTLVFWALASVSG